MPLSLHSEMAETGILCHVGFPTVKKRSSEHQQERGIGGPTKPSARRAFREPTQLPMGRNPPALLFLAAPPRSPDPRRPTHISPTSLSRTHLWLSPSSHSETFHVTACQISEGLMPQQGPPPGQTQLPSPRFGEAHITLHQKDEETKDRGRGVMGFLPEVTQQSWVSRWLAASNTTLAPRRSS